jgi:Zn-dependent peptidase ImmA (M78 family)/transcriptional regulator with XRE-family HTH domain
MGKQVNHGLLRIARQHKGVSQGEAARGLGIPQVTLSRYENGVTHPGEEFIGKASILYDLPDSFFYQPDVVFGAPVSVHPMWRKKHDVTGREMDIIVAELNIRTIHIRRLLQAVEHVPKRDIPKFDLDEYEGDIERIAALVRAHWLLPAGPLGNLTAALEMAGCIVVHSDMQGSAISGVTVSVAGIPPIILLNKDQPADRMRFTLAHELGHMVLHRFPGPNMEREANEFASALLMPARDIRGALSGRIDLRRLAALKPEWRVSMQGLLYRAQALEIIDKGEAAWLWRQFSSLRMRMREPPELDFPAEIPSVLPKMVRLHLDAFGYSLDELAALFHIHPHTLSELYSPDKAPAAARPGRLRLVQ